jgi:hypothetical protein
MVNALVFLPHCFSSPINSPITTQLNLISKSPESISSPAAGWSIRGWLAGWLANQCIPPLLFPLSTSIPLLPLSVTCWRNPRANWGNWEGSPLIGPGLAAAAIRRIIRFAFASAALLASNVWGWLGLGELWEKEGRKKGLAVLDFAK